MSADPDGPAGPGEDWYQAELDSARGELDSLRATVAAQAEAIERAERRAERWRHVALDHLDPDDGGQVMSL